MVEKLTVIGLPGESGYWQQPQEMFDINWDLLDLDDVIEITNDVALRRVPRFTAREAAALLEITPGTEAALRLGRRATSAAQGINVPFVDLHILADELASYGPEVRVVEPALLREAVISRLRAVVRAHTDVEEAK